MRDGRSRERELAIKAVWAGTGDVIWAPASFQDLRDLAPAGSALRRWLPGLAVELARQRTGWIGVEHQ